MQRMPKKVQVFGYEVSVKVVELEDNHGEFNESEREITIDANDKYKVQKSTLLHECLHAVISLTGIKQGNLSDELEEVIVTNIENYLNESPNWEIRLKQG